MRTAAPIRAEDFAIVAQIIGPCELVKGEIVPTSPGSVRHSRVTGNASWILESHCRAHGIGRVLLKLGVIVARRPDTVRGADVACISYARLPKGGPLPTGFLQRPPELVIEVLGEDTSWEKMEEKVADYHGLAVDLVWVLDPQTLSLRVYERGRAPLLVRDTETASADPYVPGFSCEVSAFFQD
jgi:Uma2 family endonuclease